MCLIPAQSFNKYVTTTFSRSNAPDNVDWSSDGFIYVQEDGSGNGMFQMSARNKNEHHRDRHRQLGAFGIFDVSNYAGYAPGSVILTSIQGRELTADDSTVLLAPARWN